MTTQSLLDLLHDKGVELWADGNKLRFSAPRGALSDDLRTQLARRKAEILATLNSVNGTPRENGAADKPLDELVVDHYGPGSASHTELYRQRFRAQDEQRKLLSAAPAYFRHVNPCQAHLLQVINMDKQFVRGAGCELFDRAGNRYLDFVAAYGALPFGHNPDAIWDAIENVRRAQAPNFVQPSVLDAAGELAERLIGIAPPGMQFVTFANSGAEAVEAALKLCRSTTGRRGILSTTNSFHGKTLGALSATGKRVYQAAFNAPAQDFHYIPFGDCAALEKALDAAPKYYAALIVEPIQGEGGIVEPPRGYLAEVAAICRRHNTLLIVDEVQTGLGRTGEMFACNRDGVTPDVITLAKALGGGIMPIGAVLYTEEVLNEQFAMQHTSTFAGNTVACRAGLAALELLERDDRALLRHVKEVGAYLKSGLTTLVDRYPDLAKSARGEGLLLGLQFDLKSPLFARGFLRYLADQQLFTYALAAYLLNVHRVRVAPTLSAPDVLRIEPPLVVEKAECDVLLDALDETLSALQSGGAAHIIAHLVDADLRPPLEKDKPVGRAHLPVAVPTGKSARPTSGGTSFTRQCLSDRPPTSIRDNGLVIATPSTEASSSTAADEGRFAFLTHPLDEEAWTYLDPCLGAFTKEEMEVLKSRVVDLLDPVSVGEVVIESATGQRARGEFVMLPFSAREIAAMPYQRALAEVRYAVELAAQRGAKIVGLGGFNSIVTQGGLALSGDGIVPLTTGNSFTVAAGIRALQLACTQRSRAMPTCTAAVLGAGGALGKALATLLAERVSRLLLVGNPSHPQRSRARLMDVAASILQHLWHRHQQGAQFESKTIGARLASIAAAVKGDLQDRDFARLAQDLVRQDCIAVSTSAQDATTQADLVVTATSSVDNLFDQPSFKADAIVCELSRPFNVGEDVKRARRDVLFIEGGITRVPGAPDLGFATALPKGVTFACAAETMMLALEKTYKDTSLGIDLDLETVHHLERLSEKHGFEVVI